MLSTYCTTHQQICFGGNSTSYTCRKGSLHINNVIEEHKHDTNDMFIADFYLPHKLLRHRIVRGGGPPPQLQFLTQWQDGWTSDRSLAKNVIRKHPTEDLWLVAYKDSWEPLSNDVITYAMITLYKEDHKIQQFGFRFDELLKKISIQNRPPIRTETIHPSNIFHYVEVEQDLDELEPPMRRKRGRPKTGKQKEKRMSSNARSCTVGEEI